MPRPDHGLPPKSAEGAIDMQPCILKPYQQGSLDSLCGLYAAINAMRRATRDEAIKDNVWDDVFESLVLCTETHVGIAHALIAGIGTKPLVTILEEVFAELTDRFELRLRVWRPLRGLTRRDPDCLLDQIEWFTQQPSVGVMATITGATNHWTVLEGMDADQVYIFDSSGMTSIQRSACTGHRELCDASNGRVVAKSVIVIERV